MIEYESLCDELKNKFSMNGLVNVTTNRPISREAGNPNSHRFYSNEYVEDLIQKASRKESNYYGQTDAALFKAIEKYPIQSKSCVVMGSTCPWYESICIANNALEVTCVEYNKIKCDNPKITYYTVDEFKNNLKKFDFVLSISSFEHDGLGRYGDPINPDGDLEAMSFTKQILKDDGILFLAVPSHSNPDKGEDRIDWNLHRVYGKHRFPLLINGYNLLDVFPAHSQPIFVLKKSS